MSSSGAIAPTCFPKRGPLDSARGKPARRLVRSTTWYINLLNASHHPRYLVDAVKLEAFLHDRLQAAAPDLSWYAGIEEKEVADLIAGDIPYFASPIGEPTRLAVSRGATVTVPGDGWEECRARIRSLSAADMERQTWLIRVAMADLGETQPPSPSVRRNPLPAADRAELIAAAARVGDRLCDLAIVEGGRASWLVPAPITTTRLRAVAAGPDLYSGLSGIALFLGVLGSLTSEKRYIEICAAAVAEAIALCENDGAPAGAYDGVGGAAYTLAQLAGLLDRPEWAVAASRLVRKAARPMARSSGSRPDLGARRISRCCAGRARQRGHRPAERAKDRARFAKACA